MDVTSSSIKDRIKLWQEQGGGVVEVSGPLSAGQSAERAVSSQGLDVNAAQTPNPTPLDVGLADTPHTPSGRSEQRLRHESVQVQSRPRSAPTKRVVSDGHWRRNGKETEGSLLDKKTGRYAGLQSQATGDCSELDFTGSHLKSSSLERRERRKRRTKSTAESTRAHEPDHVHAGVNGKNNAEEAFVDTGGEHLQQENSKVFSSLSITNRSKNGGRRRSSKHDQNQGPSLMVRTIKGSLRSEKSLVLRRVLSDSRKALDRQTSEAIVTPRIPSIQAWLENMPDPFTDDSITVMDSADQRNALLSTAAKHQSDLSKDPNEIWDILSSEDPDHHSNPRRRRNRSSSRDRGTKAVGTTGGMNPPINETSCIHDEPHRAADSHLSPGLENTPNAVKRRHHRKSAISPLARASLTKPREPMAKEKVQDEEIKAVQNESPHAFTSPIICRNRIKDRKESQKIASDGKPTNADSPITLNSRSIHGKTSEVDEHLGLPTTQAVRERSVRDLKRYPSRLRRHSDLISVLSMPRHDSKRTKGSRSSRTVPDVADSASVQGIMYDLEKEETGYAREIRTLIDGVVPVLLTCVLSKAESAVAEGLFRSPETAVQNSDITRPIIDMAIALERLRSLHRRIPLKEPYAFLTWAQGAKRVYDEYLKAWRLGFQDVEVTLAPGANVSSGSATGAREILHSDAKEGVATANGEKVDVAFLLKRPLVRVKHLAKVINAINVALPSTESAQLATQYKALVQRARARVEEEHARLEDEAAANIDVTKSRDPQSLAPLHGVIIDASRRVRARDHYNCSLQHSTGQSLDCQVELICREEAAEGSHGGDLLICEVDESGRWLLFPPISLNFVSARAGQTVNDLILMIRGSGVSGNQWQEMLLLNHFDDSTIQEWRNMLESQPVPPTLKQSASFVQVPGVAFSATDKDFCTGELLAITETMKDNQHTSQSDIQIPIGEYTRPHSSDEEKAERPSEHMSLNEIARSQINRKQIDKTYSHALNDLRYGSNDLESLPSQSPSTGFRQGERQPGWRNNEAESAGWTSSAGLKRNNAKRHSRHYSESRGESCSSSRSSSPRKTTVNRKSSLPLDDSLEAVKTNGRATNLKRQEELELKAQPAGIDPNDNKGCLPTAHERPHVSRGSVEPDTLAYDNSARVVDRPVDLTKSDVEPLPSRSALSTPTRKPLISKYRQRSPLDSGTMHAQPICISPQSLPSPIPGARPVRPRRSSSPLKQQCGPPIDSEVSDPESDLEDFASMQDDISSVTESIGDDDEEFEAKDIPMPLMPLKMSLPGVLTPSNNETPEGSIKPSDSASQAPYKNVPVQHQETMRTIASMFAWSDQGSWELLHPDECSIVVSPGLIEAFEMSAAHSAGLSLPAKRTSSNGALVSDDASQVTGQNDGIEGERPLVALELTPLVPLRRGTAIDISIRSPPTPKSIIRSSNNIMFRSRSAEECEILYAMINHARIHNPTYIALQNARGPFFTGATYADAMARRPGSQATSARSSWFGGLGRTTSYRAKSKRTPSISPSQSSVGTMSSAFSALRRFGRGNGGRFNIALSTISSRQGTGSDQGAYSLSDNSSGKDMAAAIAPGMVANNDGSLGLKDAKIRLYQRENASRWRDLGSARLTILQPEHDLHSMQGDGRIMHAKRVLVHGKTKGEVLLDAQLGESSFERVARTGIAMSIWEDVVGPNGETGRAGAVGGVAAVKTKTYMIQLKSEAETAYTFSLVGKLRY